MSDATENATLLSMETRFLDALKYVLPPDCVIPLHEPLFNGNEWNYVKECIDTGWVSSVGKFVDEFERRLAEITGSNYAIATVNGTAALHVSLWLAGVRSGDEVLVPGLSFVATANAVAQCGATPHFIDSEEKTLGVDPYVLRDYLNFIVERRDGLSRNKNTGCNISALVPMHTFGHPVDLDGLLSVASDFGIPIVEDAAESLGSYFNGQHTGTLGLFGALSFNGTKIVTTGGGGAILTQDREMAEYAKHLTTTAKKQHRWEFFHDAIAWNYRMPNLNAALGCAQLEKLEDFIASKRRLAKSYQSIFSEDPDFHFVQEPSGTRSNYWLNTILLRNPSLVVRDRLLALANDAGFMARPAWTLLNKLPMYTSCPAAPLSVAESLSKSIINLPSSPSILMRGAL
jgi:perosamine synthetase